MRQIVCIDDPFKQSRSPLDYDQNHLDLQADVVLDLPGNSSDLGVARNDSLISTAEFIVDKIVRGRSALQSQRRHATRLLLGIGGLLVAIGTVLFGTSVKKVLYSPGTHDPLAEAQRVVGFLLMSFGWMLAGLVVLPEVSYLTRVNLGVY